MNYDFAAAHGDDGARCGAVGIQQEGRIRRKHRLREVIERHVPVILAETCGDHRLSLGENDKLLAGNLCRDALGDIIDRRTESAGCDDDVGAAERKAVRRFQADGIIAHDGLMLLGDTEGGETTREELRVGIKHLPHQELSADAEDFRNHPNSPRNKGVKRVAGFAWCPSGILRSALPSEAAKNLYFAGLQALSGSAIISGTKFILHRTTSFGRYCP